MRISLNQLGRWVDRTKLTDADDVAHQLTMLGLEVEDVVHFGQGHEAMVIGKIEAIEEHPKADRLVICRVNVGDDRLRQIACGATNMKAGDVVPVALPGARPPGIDFEIGSRKVAGVMSEGMLCAEEELGLAAKSDGLWILDGDLPLGKPVFEALDLVDTFLEIGITPNRPDCLSHFGIAREVAAIYETELDAAALNVEPEPWELGEGGIGEAASLDVQDSQGCPRYIAAVLENVKVGPSPAWLQKMVTAMGMRSINNVVDVTNVVNADIGQPLHAFDLDKLEGNTIIVRRAESGETLAGIDHKTYQLELSDLVIADANRPVAIAGVMGGVDTEVTETTTRVLLECAYFQPMTVRKTSKRLGIHTESSHRFERGIDPGATRRNAAYAVSLLLRTQSDSDANCTLRSGILEHYPNPIAPVRITVPVRLVERVLGIAVAADEIVSMLGSIEIEGRVTEDGSSVDVTAPTFRPDLERPIDIVEEIARLWGYDRFESTLPTAAMGATHAVRAEPKHGLTILPRRRLRFGEETRVRLLSAGLHEAVSYSFMSAQDLALLGLDPESAAAPVANPLTQDQAFMRTSLLPALLRALAVNVAQRSETIGLFESARRFELAGDANNSLALLVTGPVGRHFTGNHNWDFFDLKGLVESLIGPRGSESQWSRPESPEPYLHPGVQAVWSVDDRELGIVGQVHPGVLAELDVELDAPVFVAELDFDAMAALEGGDRSFESFPRFPAMTRDFALLNDVESDYQAVREAVSELAAADPTFGSLFESLQLFDLYQGEQVPDGKKSLAIQVVYRSSERTLTDDEVGRADNALLQHLREKIGATLR